METRRSLIRAVMVFTSASVGLRSTRRSVSRTKGLASRSAWVGVGISCSMVGSLGDAPLLGNSFTQRKGEAGFPPPLWSPSRDSAGSSGPGGLHMVHRLLGRSFRHREYRYEGAAACFCTKLDFAFDLGEQGVVGAHADIKAGMPGGAALTRDDVTGNHMLAAVRLDAKALTGRITSVPR